MTLRLYPLHNTLYISFVCLVSITSRARKYPKIIAKRIITDVPVVHYPIKTSKKTVDVATALKTLEKIKKRYDDFPSLSHRHVTKNRRLETVRHHTYCLIAMKNQFADIYRSDLNLKLKIVCHTRYTSECPGFFYLLIE